MLNNPDFKGVEFDPFLKEAGSHSFTMSPSRWIEETGAIGLISKNGANGGTFVNSQKSATISIRTPSSKI